MSLSTNGWDAIIAVNQNTLNKVLAYAFAQGQLPHQLSAQLEILPGYFVDINVQLAAPSMMALPEGQRTVAVDMPIASGTMTLGTIAFPLAGMHFVVKTALLYVESDVVPTVGTNYDLTLDFSSTEAFVGVDLTDVPPALQPYTTAIETGLRDALRQQAGGKSFTVATVNLDGFAQEQPELVPTLADYTYTLNEDDNGLSIFGVLLLTVSTVKGQPTLPMELTPANDQSVALMSNALLMGYLIRKQVAEALKVSSSQLRMEPSGGGLAVRNNGDVTLESVDHKPTLKDLNIRVANNTLAFDMAIAATVSEGINLTYNISATYAFEIKTVGGEQQVELVQKTYEEDHNTEVEWWVWVVGIVLAPIIAPILAIWGPILAAVIIVIIKAVVDGLAPTVGSKGLPAVVSSVKWNYADVLNLSEVSLPEPLRIDATLTLPQAAVSRG
nr:TULIP family P47-like protein [uncultured Roseateles sp.]